VPDPEEDLPAVKWAEYPQRKCRQVVTEGLIDHFCDLPELHPGPDCPSTLRSAIRRRQEWERDHPGWEKLADPGDPFADLTERLKES
jgi:hypothetical protein